MEEVDVEPTTTVSTARALLLWNQNVSRAGNATC